MVTIKDLAKVAGVSPTTVSNVLHGRTNKVSEETLEKVQKAIIDMNYVSNMGGRLLARRGSKIIGVIMTYARREENNAAELPFYSEIIGSLEDAIRENGYYMMLYTSGSIEESMKLAHAWDIEGLIVLGNTPEEAKLFYESITVPVVFIDTYGSGIPNIGIDDHQAMKSLVEYLIDLGHKKIAFLSDSEVLIGVDKARFEGYFEAMSENGLVSNDERVFHLSFRDSIRRAMLKELCSSGFYGCTALCFSSDYYAVDAISFLSELGVKIPEDISITGFDNNILAKFSNPRLTTINQNVSKKGTVAVIELMGMIKKGEKEIVKQKLDTFLVEGQSTKFIFETLENDIISWYISFCNLVLRYTKKFGGAFMKKMGKIGIITGMFLLSLGLTGCGATGNENSAKEVKFFNGKTESVELMDDLIEEFNSNNKEYKVVQEFQKDASSALQTKFASGDVPDIVSADITQDYIDNELFMDLSAEDFWNNVDPSIKEMVTDVKSGKQFKVALAKSIGGVFYNKDIVAEVKTDTWENFISSINIKKENVTPMFLGGKDSWTLGQLMEFWGHGLVKQDYPIVEAKKYFIDNDQDILKFSDANGPINIFAQRLESLKKDGIINENAATASYDDQIDNFASGKVACIPQGIWAVSLIKEKNPDINLGFAAFAPMEDGKKPAVLSAEDSTLGIPAKSKNQEGAKAFIKFLLEKENLKKYSETLHLPSAYNDVDSKWIDNPDEYESVIKQSVSVGYTVFPSGFSGDDSGRYVQAFLSGQYSSSDDFAKAYSNAWNKAWDDSK